MATVILFALAGIILTSLIIKIGIVMVKMVIRLLKGVFILLVTLGGMDLWFGSHLAASLFASMLKAAEQILLLVVV